MAVKLVNLGEGFKAPTPGSKGYDVLANTITSGFQGVLANVPGFHKLMIEEFTESDGDLVAKMNVVMDQAQYEKGRALTESSDPIDVERTLLETVQTGHVGNLAVDPEYFVFEPQGLTSSIPVDGSTDRNGTLLSSTKLYIVLGCIAALVFVAVIQAACTIYRAVRTPSSRHKDKLIPNSAWKDYSVANTNYAFEAFESDEVKPTGASVGSTMTLPSNGSSRVPQPAGGKHANGNHPQASHYADSKLHGGHYADSKPHGGHYADSKPHGGHYADSRVHGGHYADNKPHGGHYADSKSLQRPRGGYPQPPRERSTYSLPRQAHLTPQHSAPHNGYYTQERSRGPQRPQTDLQPDFYFMPSQRKYSGEVVRVYVDYNNSPDQDHKS